MKKYDTIIGKLNFRKIIIGYIIAALVAGTLSVGFLCFEFRNEFSFAKEFKTVREKVEDNQSGTDAVKPELTSLATSSPNIIDILILNRKNEILFSAKDSSISKSGSLNLIVSTDSENRFLTDKAIPDVYYKLMKNDSIVLTKDMIGNEKQVKQGYEDDYFHENNFTNKKIYMLSYIADKASGDKIYFISDIQPVANGELYVKAVAALTMLFFMIYWVLLAVWVYKNSQKAKLAAPIWGIITLFTNIAGLFVYMIFKQSNRTCFKCSAVQSKTNIFCSSCGTKLGNTCEKCSSTVSDKDSYCKNCGNEICNKQEQE
ncbi:MAG: zinc ribbon domain-containing protein [Eubacteriales bacterium]